MNLGDRGCSEPRSHHSIPARASFRDMGSTSTGQVGSSMWTWPDELDALSFLLSLTQGTFVFRAGVQEVLAGLGLQGTCSAASVCGGDRSMKSSHSSSTGAGPAFQMSTAKLWTTTDGSVSARYKLDPAQRIYLLLK